MSEENKSVWDFPGQQPGMSETPEPPKKSGKRKGGILWGILRVVIILVIIAVGVYVILWAVARAGKYDSIRTMLDQMYVDLELMWSRIIS